jgi:hypothetical protein
MAAILMTNSDAVTHRDSIARLVPGGAQNLAQLSDDELLANTRRLVGKSNQLLAALLVHLAEVEVRGAHRTRSCASLYNYCIYELRFSEDAAARRSAAARFAKAFPALLDAVAAGELHLTGLLMIAPHLTPENHENVLGLAKFRTKRELAKLVRELNPLPEVPDRIEPLGPARTQPATSPTWEQMVTSWAPEVRELAAGERPADWANDGSESRFEDVTTEGCGLRDEALPVGPVPSDLPPIAGPQHFQMQFGTTEEHVQLVERAQALLARTRPRVALGELHLEAMKLLVAALEKKKFGVTERSLKASRSTSPRRRGELPDDASRASPQPRQRVESADDQNRASPQPRQRVELPGDANRVSPQPRQRVEIHAENGPSGAARRGSADGADDAHPASIVRCDRGRYVAAAVRHDVYRRDGARCTYVDVRGNRCCETRYLELHHLQPFAKDGPNIASNLTLRCSAHNALAAELDFGSDFIARRRASARHETFTAQTRAGGQRVT